MAHVKIKRNRAIVRIQLPLTFYEGIFQETEGLALAVTILDKKCNTTDDSVARQLQEDESLAEVGMYPVKDDLCRSYWIDG
jgi:hypothetical protein